MIIYENKGYETRLDLPDSDWTGEAKFVVPDGSELANKIIANYPYYEFVTNENGELIDIEPTERPEPVIVEPEPTEIEKLRADVDYISIMTGIDL